ncbi:hypothetical protein ES707_15973 [subsurface metagenome]|jgi:hypothetical protein
MPAKYALYDELDDAGKETGRIQVVEETDDLVFATFEADELEKAKKEMARLQAESDREDQIEKEYLDWEKQCLSRHKITKDELRVFLVNCVII